MYSGQFTSQAAALHYDSVVYSDQSHDSQMWHLETQWLSEQLRGLGEGVPTARYLDYACGTGRVLSFFSQFATCTTGIDSSAAMLQKAHVRVPKATLLCGNVAEDPSALHGEFDLITTFRFVLNTEPDVRQKVFASLADRLTPQGLLIFNIHGNRHSIRHFGVVRDRRRGINHCEMAFAEAEHLVRKAGLQVLCWRGFGLTPARAYRSSMRTIARKVDRFACGIESLARISQDLVFVCGRRSRA